VWKQAGRLGSLPYNQLDRPPLFVGLYVGNALVAYFVNVGLWFSVLYFFFCKAVPNLAAELLAIAAPVVLEQSIRFVVWDKIIDTQRGLRHPRLYSVADWVLSTMSVVTGPVKTLVRVSVAILCLILSLFRVDLMVMGDTGFTRADMHYATTAGLFVALRVKFEFEKIARYEDAAENADICTRGATPTNSPSNAERLAKRDYGGGQLAGWDFSRSEAQRNSSRERSVDRSGSGGTPRKNTSRSIASSSPSPPEIPDAQPLELAVNPLSPRVAGHEASCE
jgi:hypothetical protein